MRFQNNEPIVASYTTNYNIHIIDDKIRNCFDQETKHLPILMEELKRLEWIKENSDKYEVDKAKKEMLKVKEKIDDIKGQVQKGIYMEKVKDIIELYDDLQPLPTKKVFGVKSPDQPDPHLENRLKMIGKYLNIAKKYYPLNITRSIMEDKCPQCQMKMQDDMLGKVCSNNKCGYFTEAVEPFSCHKDSSHSNNKSQYDTRENFAEGIRNFQGKQPKRPSDKVMAIINEEIEKFRINPKTISKHDLLQILKNKKLSSDYCNLNLIHNIITGIPPPDISEYESVLMHRYDLYEEVYEEIKPTDRQNSLGIQYLLQAFLSMEGYECNKDDFSTLKTREVVLDHGQLVERACKILAKKFPNMNWKFTPI